MRGFLVFLLGLSASAQSRFPFATSQKAEVVATLEMSSEGGDWAKKGREAAVAAVWLDGKLHQHVMLAAGPRRQAYRVSLGLVTAGAHELRIERDKAQSAPDAGFGAHGARFEEIPPGHPDYEVYANAPVLFARLNTLGRFSDVPLLLYAERLHLNGEPILQYTVIFSNEDGGTSTRTLMGRWGRTTDIEYVYRRSLKTGVATVQGPNHLDMQFNGAHEGGHPLLMPVTDNNMIAEAKDSPLKFRLAPLPVDLSQASREQVMDQFPFTYQVMAKELEREGKLRPFGAVDGEKISDPRNYLFIDYAARLASAALTAMVRLKDGKVYTSDLGRGDVAIARDGYVRTTVELPPGTTSDQITAIGFECRVPPPSRNESAAHSGTCRLQSVVSVFQLGADYGPGKSMWSSNELVTIPTGQGVLFTP